MSSIPSHKTLRARLVLALAVIASVIPVAALCWEADSSLISRAKQAPGIGPVTGAHAWLDNHRVAVYAHGGIGVYNVTAGTRAAMIASKSRDYPSVAALLEQGTKIELYISLGKVHDGILWGTWWESGGQVPSPRPMKILPSPGTKLEWLTEAKSADRMVWEFSAAPIASAPVAQSGQRAPVKATGRDMDDLWVSRKDGTGMRLIGGVRAKPVQRHPELVDSLVPQLSPDGKWIVIRYNDHLWVLSLP